MVTQSDLICKYTEYTVIHPAKDLRDGTCMICGEKRNGVIAKKVIRNERFTNFDEIHIDGDVVCKHCEECMKNAALRRRSFIAHAEGLVFLEKNDIEKYIFGLEAQGIKAPFIVCITQSFKKHMFFRAVMNNDFKRYYIQAEEEKLLFDVTNAKKLYDILNDAYLYFSKEELLTLNFKTMSAAEYGVNRVGDLLKVLTPYRQTSLYKLLVHIMNSEVRNEKLKARRS